MSKETRDLLKSADPLKTASTEQRKDFAASAATTPYNDPTKSVMLHGYYKAELYHEMYEPVLVNSSMRSIRLRTLNEPIVTRKSLELFPGQYSMSEEHVKLIIDLSEEIKGKLPSELDNDGFAKSLMIGDADKLKTLAGYSQTPMSYRPLDNTVIRKEYDLRDFAELTVKEKTFLKELLRLLLVPCSEPKPIHITKFSNGGFPRFSSDPQWKMTYAEYMTRPGKLEAMLSCFKKGDRHELMRDHEIVLAYHSQKRVQVDKPDKVRMVNDLEYALSSGKRGKRFPADKRVVVPGIPASLTDQLTGERIREVSAGAWTINFCIQLMWTHIQQHLFEDYGHIFHSNNPEGLLPQLVDKHIVVSDITECDTTHPLGFAALVHEVMKERFNEDLVDLSFAYMQAPILMRPVDFKGKPVWLGKLFDRQGIFRGLGSGHGGTSVLTKLLCACDTALRFIRMPRYNDIKPHELLAIDPRFVWINNGDDQITGFSDPGDLRDFEHTMTDPKTAMLKVNKEEGYVYSGMVLRKDVSDAKGLSYTAGTRVLSLLEKFVCNERSIGGPLRSYWAIGFKERINMLSQSAEGREALSLYLFYHDKYLGHKGKFDHVLTRSLRELPIYGNALSDIDYAVLENPDLIHYKIDAAKVSKKVLDLVASSLPVSDVEKVLPVVLKT